MANTKEIRTKIASIKSTQKITSAMEKVAASKMRAATAQVSATRPYARVIREIISHVAIANSDYKHAFMDERAIRRIGYIVISSDRGLCGGLNTNMLKTLVKDMQVYASKGIEVDLCVIGSKAQSFFKSFGGNVIASANGFGENPQLLDIIGTTKTMMESYSTGNIDRVFIVYNRFVSTMVQQPVLEQIIPILHDKKSKVRMHWDYIYEANPRVLLDSLVKRYVESSVYQAVVENIASEHSARMLAMQSATDNAGNLINELQLMFNKARQAAITQEISEIVGGASAV